MENNTGFESIKWSACIRLVHDFMIAPGKRYFHVKKMGDHAVHYFLAGSGTYRLNGRDYTIGPGCAAFPRPGEEYEFILAPEGTARMLNLHFDLEETPLSAHPFPVPAEDCSGKVPLPPEFAGFLRLQNPGRYEKLFRKLHSLQELSTPLAILQKKRIFLEMLEFFLQENSGNQPVSAGERIGKLLEKYATGSTDFPSAELLAKEAGMSRNTFYRKFREYTGMTLHAYCTRKRILEARADLLQSGCSPKEAAEKHGFANVHHFTRLFRSVTGETPGMLKKSVQIDKK